MKLTPFTMKIPSFFRINQGKIFFVDTLSRTLFIWENGSITPFKKDLKSLYHPLFTFGCPYAFTDEGPHFDEECVFLEGGKQRAYGMDAKNLYRICKGGKEVLYKTETSLLGFSVSPLETQILLHESVEGASFYDKTALSLLDISSKNRTPLYQGESLVTHYGFQEDGSPFFLSETDPILAEKGLDGFKRRPLGAKNSLFFKNTFFLLFTHQGEDGLYVWEKNGLEKIALPLTSIDEMFADTRQLFVSGRTASGEFTLLKAEKPLEGKNWVFDIQAVLDIQGNFSPYKETKNYSPSTLEPLPFHWGKGWITGKFDPNKPTLIRIHSGPIVHTERVVTQEIEMAVELGYQVLLPNYRGSTGYGRNHRMALLNNYGNADVEDVVHLIRELKNQGVKSSNIYLKGKSSAGLTAILSSIQEEVQKLAIYCPVTVNDPHDEELIYLFPKGADFFKRMCKLRTPTILFQGDKDLIVAKEKTDRYVASLDRASFSLSYEILKGEGHSIKGEMEQACLKKEFSFFSNP